MKQHKYIQSKKCVQLLLASTLFMSTAYGLDINAPTAGPINVLAGDPVLNINPAGQINGAGDGVVVNTSNAFITTVGPNTQGSQRAIDLTGGGSIGIDVLANKAGATITIDDQTELFSSFIGIQFDAGFNTLTNSGNISGNNIGIYVLSNTNSGTITNKAGGQMLSPVIGSVFFMEGGSLTQFENLGTITANSNVTPMIFAGNTASATIVNGLINQGTIVNTGTADVINFQGAQPANITLFQQAGSITGPQISLRNTSGIALDMTGGTINAVVNLAAGANSIVNLSGGVISQNILLGNTGDTINMSGGSYQGIVDKAGVNVGPHTFNISGGTFTTVDLMGNQTTDVMNIIGTGPVQPGGTINDVPTIDISAPFIADGTITNLDTLLRTNVNGSLTLNTTITGTGDFVNNGLTEIGVGPASSINLTGANGYSGTGTLSLAANPQAVDFVADNFNMTVAKYHQEVAGGATGTLIVNLANTNSFSAIQTTGGNIEFDANSLINVNYGVAACLPTGTVFPIIQGGTVVDNGVVVTTNSLTLDMQKATSNGNTEFDLVLHRSHYSLLVSNPIAQSIGGVLYNMSEANGFGNPEFINLICQLDEITTVEGLTEALVALSPDVSYGMIKAAQIGMDRMFGLIWQRVEDILSFRAPWYGGSYRPSPFYAGYNGGDEAEARSCGFWIAPYGQWLRQKKHSYSAGYKAEALGLAMGYDTDNEVGTVSGWAVNFTNAKAVGLSNENNVENVRSLQGTWYSLWQPCDAIYMDAMLGLAYSNFQNDRNIDIGNIHLNASSAFNGWQLGGQYDIGYVDCETTFYIIPVGRIKGSYLRLQSFTEKNAGSLGLDTKEKNLTQLQAGGGIRFAKEVIGYPYSYMPELSFIYLYELSGKGQQTVANFIGGGTSFPTIGVRPPRNIFLIDAAFDAYHVASKQNVFTMRYELELRNKYFSHSGYIEYAHHWL